MANRASARAHILKRVLRYINAEDYVDLGDRMEFGTKAKSESEELQAGTHLTARDVQLMGKVSDVCSRAAGQLLSHERTSLETSSHVECLLKQLDALAAGHSESRFAAAWVQLHKDLVTGPSAPEAPSVLSRPQIDALDQRYAEEMLGKLETVVSRAARLQKIELERVPRRAVRLHFEEAHRCYLYGFNVACAVLCRAILESALKETIDPKGDLRRVGIDQPTDSAGGSTDRRESYIRAMIGEARISGRLSDPLPDWARQLKDAGDEAIHNVEAFEKKYPSEELEAILCKARKVVESLYAVRGNPRSR